MKSWWIRQSGGLAFHARQAPFLARHLGLVRPKHRVLGVDSAGQVEAVGGGVTRFKPGDVYANLLDHGYGGLRNTFPCQGTSCP